MATTGGFTLIEVMMVVVIIGVLATLSLVGYQRHLRSGRLVAAQEFVSRIQAREESYFQQWGTYVGTSAGFYPPLGGAGAEPTAKPWTAIPAEWVTLGARPESDTSYFAYSVVASNPAGGHALDAIAPLLGIPAQPTAGGPLDPHAWYYVIGHGDLNGDASYATGGCAGGPLGISNCTIVASSSARGSIVRWNEGE
ncbi:MAG: prepilin-type N-terminal cleavage/methylation domain-containing protein [Proteobacteria bacterium]|nr:prepilin-type N-terminal cleavage/methylation domain-containing protein [Pseudomonadota bacterium]